MFIKRLYTHYLSFPKVVCDSREEVTQALFFCLRGKKYNANQFAAQALEQGAAYVVVDDPRYYQAKNERYIFVADTLVALQQLAAWHRRQLNIPIIAITGSTGKTTTKELAYAVLSQKYACFATVGNLNNHIGVPLTLLSIPPTTEVAILEMGANHVGEIAQLCTMAQPTHGLITNIGPAHLEGFGSLEGVIQGKKELYDFLRQHAGIVFVNDQDPVLVAASQGVAHPVYYTQVVPGYQVELMAVNPHLVYKSNDQGESRLITTQLLGKHQLSNVVAALCMAQYFKVPAQLAHAAIAAYCPSNNRSQLIQKGSNTIVLDAYNANPTSMCAALDVFAAFNGQKKIVILADMNELGEASDTFHQEVVRKTTQQLQTQVILYGKQMGKAASHNPAALYFDDMEGLRAYLKSCTFHHTAFLIKGSRSYQLERLLACINEGA
eukprot:gene3-4_t